MLNLTGHTDYIWCTAINNDNTRLVTGAKDNTSIIWDLNKGTILFILLGHTNAVFGVAISNDNTRVVTGSADNNVIIWDFSTGLKLLIL